MVDPLTQITNNRSRPLGAVREKALKIFMSVMSFHSRYQRNIKTTFDQCRATLQALVQLKQPSNTTFVKQANIAQGHQQVNNLAEKNITPQNELLKDSYAELDNGTTPTTKGIDTTLEALGKINGRKNTGRQEKVRAECL